MIGWILALLAVAAIASFLGMNRVSGVALTGAKILIVVALFLFLLVVLAFIAIA